ncbi:Hypothetical protein AA314_04200 [Archangium gephyra]|uniref:Uncharacterized protein n=1 Tax=Archangium gephyra TaxID=48 RepID=A0AAC8Q831_9BACT|nr:Hypothetical protein AA314_04200 [Archangium gephyra]
MRSARLNPESGWQPGGRSGHEGPYPFPRSLSCGAASCSAPSASSPVTAPRPPLRRPPSPPRPWPRRPGAGSPGSRRARTRGDGGLTPAPGPDGAPGRWTGRSEGG